MQPCYLSMQGTYVTHSKTPRVEHNLVTIHWAQQRAHIVDWSAQHQPRIVSTVLYGRCKKNRTAPLLSWQIIALGLALMTPNISHGLFLQSLHVLPVHQWLFSPQSKNMDVRLPKDSTLLLAYSSFCVWFLSWTCAGWATAPPDALPRVLMLLTA